jgi:hypothetical protein
MSIGIGSAKTSMTSETFKFNFRESIDFDCLKVPGKAVTVPGSGLKPTPKGTKNDIKLLDVKEEEQFVMNIKNILKQTSVKDFKGREWSNPIKEVIPTCSSECQDKCYCRKKK